jgi:hypothetical protein
MQYMLLLYIDEQAAAAASEEDRQAMFSEYFALTADLSEKGIYQAGAPLEATTSATTVRVRDDDQLVTDGPFAETKEQLGGYFLIEAESLDDALEVAARIPAARIGSVEIRPVIPVAAREAAAG